MNDDLHCAYDHASNCITLSTDLVRMVEMLKIAYGGSCKLLRMSWTSKGEEVRQNISKTRVQIYMQVIAGGKHWNVIGQYHISLR